MRREESEQDHQMVLRLELLEWHDNIGMPNYKEKCRILNCNSFKLSRMETY